MYIIYLFTFYLQKIITTTKMNFRQKNQIIRNHEYYVDYFWSDWMIQPNIYFRKI